MTIIAAAAGQRPAHQQPTAPAGISSRFGTAIGELLTRMAAARLRARTVRLLNSLNDQALKDIGLTRSRIDSIEQDFRYAPHRGRTPSQGAGS